MGQYYLPIILKKEDRNEPVKSWYSHDFNNGLKLMEHSFIDNEFVANVEYYLLTNPQPLVWEGDYAEDGEDNLYSRADTLHAVPEKFSVSMLHNTYVVNHEKKQFYKRPKHSNKTWVVNPLPLLTCEGNGLGGGDYFTDNKEELKLIGSWARNIIEITHVRPNDDYTEIFPPFKLNDE